MAKECDFALAGDACAGETMTHGLLTHLGEHASVRYQQRADSYRLSCPNKYCTLAATAILGDRFAGINKRHCMQRQEEPRVPR